VKESTKMMFRKHGWRVDRFIHNYYYFLFYYPYVKISSVIVQSLKYLSWFKPLIPIGKMAFNRYHAKVLSLEDTVKIFTLNEDLRIISDENKKIIPFKYATKIIFQEPDFIVVMDCPCKKSMNAPLEDLNSCIAVGRSIGSFWLEHCQKYNPRKISQTEALEIIERFRKKGHITQAFFKVATGGSTGVICNCHPDTCVSLQASRLAGGLDKSLTMTVKSGYSIAYNPERCIQCGHCADKCLFDAIKFNEGKRGYDKDICLGCGLCVGECTGKALTLYVDSDKPLPLDLDRAAPERCYPAN
jgi:NAD-dependent dihydropyrimidine dehydrogenase PreA subunit